MIISITKYSFDVAQRFIIIVLNLNLAVSLNYYTNNYCFFVFQVNTFVQLLYYTDGQETCMPDLFYGLVNYFIFFIIYASYSFLKVCPVRRYFGYLFFFTHVLCFIVVCIIIIII